MKQTAVEWLEAFMNNGKQKSEGIISLAFAKAKEMERDQIIDAVQRNWLVDVEDQVGGTRYLKEEFGKE